MVLLTSPLVLFSPVWLDNHKSTIGVESMCSRERQCEALRRHGGFLFEPCSHNREKVLSLQAMKKINASTLCRARLTFLQLARSPADASLECVWWAAINYVRMCGAFITRRFHRYCFNDRQREGLVVLVCVLIFLMLLQKCQEQSRSWIR